MQNASNEEDEDCYQVRDNRRVNWRLICHAGGQCVGQVKSALIANTKPVRARWGESGTAAGAECPGKMSALAGK